MEINLEKNEERMADFVSMTEVADIKPVETVNEQPVPPVETPPMAEAETPCTPPKRPRCCWVTIGFIAAFAAIIALFILYFLQRGQIRDQQAVRAAFAQEGGNPYILTVNNDSIVAQYVLVEILTKDLEEETVRFQKELQSKQSVLEEKYKNYQINVQNQVLTKTQMQNAEQQLTQEAAALKELQERYATILAGKQASVQKEIADSIIHVTNRINDKKYHANFVLATSAGSAIVYTNPESDITREVIAELNRTYKKSHGK